MSSASVRTFRRLLVWVQVCLDQSLQELWTTKHQHSLGGLTKGPLALKQTPVSGFEMQASRMDMASELASCATVATSTKRPRLLGGLSMAPRRGLSGQRGRRSGRCRKSVYNPMMQARSFAPTA